MENAQQEIQGTGSSSQADSGTKVRNSLSPIRTEIIATSQYMPVPLQQKHVISIAIDIVLLCEEQGENDAQFFPMTK